DELLTLSNNIIETLPKVIMNEFVRKQNVSYNREFNKVKQNDISKIKKLEEQNRPPITYQEKWLRNNSNCDIPLEVKQLLSLGPKHSLRVTPRDIKVDTLLADVEYAINNIDKDKQNYVRAKIQV
ncbi:hypothetical protein WA026_019602, partial [Henosepilachna vigintioctopunctata]